MNSLASYICAAILCVIANLAFVPNSFGQSPASSQGTQGQPAVAGTAAGADVEANTNLPTQLLQPQIGVEELEIRLVPLTGDDLKKLAKEWLKIVKSKTEEVVQAQVAITKTDGAVEDAAREKLTQIDLERRDLFDKYSSVLNAWEKKGGDAKDIASYRAYRNAIIVEEARTTDFTTLVARALTWFTDEDGGIYLLKSIGIIILSVLALLFAAGVVRRLARRWIGHVPNVSKLLQAFLVGIIYWVVLALGLMIVLSAVGVDITPLFALIGGASFIIAFALQDTLGNLASGLMIMIYRPFDEGDYVDVGGVAGTVKAVSIVATTVTTPDNQVIVIPNKNVWGNIITNVTASETRRVDLVFGISYDDSIPETLRVLEGAVASHPLVLKEPEPIIRVHELADSSVNFICRPWTKTSDYWTVYWDLMRQVKERFDEAGISIPYPQQDIHVKGASATPKYQEVAASSDPEQRAVKKQSLSIADGDEGFEQPSDDETS
ncbi:MAG: mechanosensitive ion channel family protein [Hyphomicrobiaceae bacterium]